MLRKICGYMWVTLVVVGLLGIGVVAHAQGDCDLNDAGALAQRGEQRFYDGEYDAAIADFTCAITLSPDDPALYVWRGYVYYWTFDNDSALDGTFLLWLRARHKPWATLAP